MKMSKSNEEKKMEEIKKGEMISVTFIFSQTTGELIDIKPIDGKEEELGNILDLEKLKKARITKLTDHTLLFGWGSPGCVIVKTKYGGYIKVCS